MSNEMANKNHDDPNIAFLPKFIRERYDVGWIVAFFKHKEVPVHKHSVWYYMGGISLFLFIVQIVTGVLLMVHYNAGEAHASVQAIMSQVDFGWLIRSTHSWSANLMVFFVFLHMFSVFFMKSYKYPREMTWMTGMILLAMCLGFGFSGYLLPWDQLAYFATQIGVKTTEAVPVMGGFIADMLRGGKELGTQTIERFYALHVWVLPALFMMTLGLHLLFVQLQGIHAPEFFENQPADKKKYMKFFPDFAIKDVYVWLIVMNFLGLLAVMFPWELGAEADPLAPAPAGIKPEWYFLAMFQLLKLFPPEIGPIEGELFGIMLFSLVGVLWAAIPFIDSRTAPAWRSRATFYFGIAFLTGFIIFTMWGHYSK